MRFRKVIKGFKECAWIAADIVKYPFASPAKRKYMYGVRRKCRYTCARVKECWYYDNGGYRSKGLCLDKYRDICDNLTRAEWEDYYEHFV